MLSIIPLVSLVSLFIWLNRVYPSLRWRRNWLRAIVIWGVFIIIITELLSIFHGITIYGLSLFWIVFLIVCLLGIYRCKKSSTPDQATKRILPLWYLLLPIGTIVLLTGIVAWLAPPETADSLNYHMPRVAHWAQNRTVDHFATGIEQQNSRPAFSEYAILQFYVLGQGDRLANMIEWLAMITSIIGVSLLAEMLGANTIGQYLAAVFVVSLPMGIAQASSTMNDYVMGMWIICVAEVFLRIWSHPSSVATGDIFFIASSAGLAIATKPVSFAYLLPFAFATVILLLRAVPIRKMLVFISITILICLALNAGMMIRNMITYRSFMDPAQTSIHINELRNWRGLISNLLRNAGLQASTPWNALNYQLSRFVQGIHFKLGIALNDPRTTAHGEFWIRPLTASISQNTAPNPLHAYLLVLLLVVAITKNKKVNFSNLTFLIIVLATFIVFSFIFKWQVFGSRYQLPFFLLFGASFGNLAILLFPKCTPYFLYVVFIVSAIWPLLGITNRPLLPLINKVNLHNAFSANHQEYDYSRIDPVNNPYWQITNMVNERDCSDVLLMLAGNSPEYFWWMEFKQTNDKTKINWLVSGTPSSKYASGSTACAVICEDCSTQNIINGMPRVFSTGNYDLFMKP